MWLRLDPAAGLMPLEPHLLLLGAQLQPSHTARSVVGRFVAAVKHQAALEWQRVCSDIRWNTGLPFSWFRGRDPSIQAAAFRDKWCIRGVVASWQSPTAASPRGSYTFRLSAAGV
eukprot:gene13824-biopygen15749